VTASGNINAAMDGQTHPSSTLDSITNGTRLSVHFSSKSPDWGTPPEFFEQLDSLFHFTLDVCATAENAKCARYFTLEQNGLAQRWTGNCWMNPPYGRKIGEWIAKAAASVRSGDATVVCLLPARTDTAWWHRHIQPILAGQVSGEVVFIRGRLRFEGAPSSAPFPSCVVAFHGAGDCPRIGELGPRRQRLGFRLDQNTSATNEKVKQLDLAYQAVLKDSAAVAIDEGEKL